MVEKKVICLSCRKKVIVYIVCLGYYGGVAVCPKCEKLAYSNPTYFLKERKNNEQKAKEI